MTAILELHSTSGSFIDLINISPGIHLGEWTPKIAQYKNGGVFQSSSLAEGRRLVSKSFDTIIETFDLKVDDLSQDLLIVELQELLRLLESATSYWVSDWVSNFIYIKVKADCETNPRYAIVKGYSIPELDNPFSQPFLQPKGAVFDALTLNIERGHWQSTIPAESTAVAISVVETTTASLTVGNCNSAGTRQPTTAAGTVFIGNKFNTRGISLLYYFDASVPSFSANLISAALPFALLPAIPAAGDIIYFATDTTGVLSSIVFDLVAQTDITGIVWEYSTNAVGPVFSTLTTQDNTNNDGSGGGVPFDTAGVKSVHWSQPSNWVQATINGSLAYWVRARVTSVGAAPTPPQQQNRKVYSITWDYVEVQSDQVMGDIPALSQMRIDARSDPSGPGGTPSLYFNRLLVGLRSKDRGENFRPYLMASADQQPSGWGITTGTDVTLAVADTRTPTADKAQYAPAALSAFADRVTWVADDPFTEEYYGVYRAFAFTDVVTGTSSTFDIRLNVQVGLVGQTITGKTANVDDNGFYTVTDLGTIEIPGTDVNSDDTMRISLILQANSASSGTLDIFGIALIPIDEWALDTYDNVKSSDSTVERGRYLDIDSIGSVKSILRSNVKFTTGDLIYNMFLSITNGSGILQANVNQRLWFLFMQSTGADGWLAPPEIGTNILINKADRYLGMRGNR